MKKKTYTHLTYEERVQIHTLKKNGWKQKDIAEELGRDPGTISRELQRNSGQRGYRYKQAHRKSVVRRKKASSVPRKMTPYYWLLMLTCLQQGWSPEQISGRCKHLGIPMAGRTWIYMFIRLDKAAGGELFRLLRHRGKKKNWRGGRRSGHGLIPNRKDISERPAIVEGKGRVGDWEGDTMIGVNHQGAIVSLVDRCSKYVLLRRVDRRTSELVTAAVIAMLASVDAVCHTITFDNGKEFAGHEEISAATGADVFFAAPYHSWERGLNEHTNGLAREDFPKGTDFRQITDAEVQRCQDWLNDRPRKVLGFKTPREVFMARKVSKSA